MFVIQLWSATNQVWAEFMPNGHRVLYKTPGEAEVAATDLRHDLVKLNAVDVRSRVVEVRVDPSA